MENLTEARRGIIVAHLGKWYPYRPADSRQSIVHLSITDRMSTEPLVLAHYVEPLESIDGTYQTFITKSDSKSLLTSGRATRKRSWLPVPNRWDILASNQWSPEEEDYLRTLHIHLVLSMPDLRRIKGYPDPDRLKKGQVYYEAFNLDTHRGPEEEGYTDKQLRVIWIRFDHD